MRLLLLGGSSSPTRHALKKLLGKSMHRLDWHSTEHGELDAEPQDYDMVLVDGGGGRRQDVEHLLNLTHRICSEAPGLPVLVLSLLETGSARHGYEKRSGHSCGISQSENGVWQVRCCLQDLALNEFAALLRDRLERSPQEPVTFEYQG
jgi:hypothetical protein